MLALLIVQLLSAVRITCQMEGKVVRGDRVPNGSCAHSVFLFMKLLNSNYVCGSSIINQRILLTAAHCVEDCYYNRCKHASAFAGSPYKYNGTRLRLKGFVIHEHYNRSTVINDIGLAAVEGQFELGRYVQRVSIVRSPSYFKVAVVAGWGLIDEEQNLHTNYLHLAEQKILPEEKCRKIIHDLPRGSFCGGELFADKYASQGDSGSALVADNYVQLGIVSFKIPNVTRSVVVYTDVQVFYNWIHHNSRKLHCCSKKNSTTVY